MIVALSNPDRERLAKLLGLLGSDHQGERDAAGLAAHRLVVERGATWGDIVCIPQTYNDRRSETSPRDNPTNPLAGRDWRKICVNCRKHPQHINRWENDFLTDIPRRSILTIKQRETLIRIVLRLQALGCVL